MVKVLFLGFLVAMMCGLGSAVPAPQLARSIRTEVFASPSPPAPSSPILEDPATRSERSTNLSYITGTARKIQLFIKNRHLQLLPDGTVNGTLDASSAYSSQSFYAHHPRIRKAVVEVAKSLGATQSLDCEYCDDNENFQYILQPGTSGAANLINIRQAFECILGRDVDEVGIKGFLCH